MATKFLKKFLKKLFFSLMAGPLLPPPLLIAWPYREEFFFGGFPNTRQPFIIIEYLDLKKLYLFCFTNPSNYQ